MPHPRTTAPHQGIGPAYSSKIVRNGVRIGDFQFFDDFKERFRALVQHAERAHGNALNVDVEKEIAYYESIRERVGPSSIFCLLSCFFLFFLCVEYDMICVWTGMLF